MSSDNTPTAEVLGNLNGKTLLKNYLKFLVRVAIFIAILKFINYVTPLQITLTHLLFFLVGNLVGRYYGKRKYREDNNKEDSENSRENK